MRGGWFWEGGRLKDVGFSVVVGNVRAIGNELLYTGRRRDPETGLQLNRNRFYAAGLGRWVHRDPIGYWGGDNNLYGYVASQLFRWVDPSGLERVKLTGKLTVYEEIGDGGFDDGGAVIPRTVSATITLEKSCKPFMYKQVGPTKFKGLGLLDGMAVIVAGESIDFEQAHSGIVIASPCPPKMKGTIYKWESKWRVYSRLWATIGIGKIKVGRVIISEEYLGDITINDSLSCCKRCEN